MFKLRSRLIDVKAIMSFCDDTYFKGPLVASYHHNIGIRYGIRELPAFLKLLKFSKSILITLLPQYWTSIKGLWTFALLGTFYISVIEK